jgi:hypothetical protein
LAFGACVERPLAAQRAETVAAPTGNPLRLRPHAVIAVIDTGVNPYHRWFLDANRTMAPSEYIPGYPKDATRLDLSLDATDYEAAFAADEAKWTALRPGTLVWIPGTKIIGGIAVNGIDGKYPVLDEDSHGSGITSVILQGCPECSIVMIDFTTGTAADSLEWVARQDWIDAVSMSWGLTMGRFAPNDPSPRLNTALKHVWQSGKLLVAAAGNTPYPYSWYLPAGSPLVIATGGVETSTHGETTLASKFPDLVSNYTNQVAHKETFTGNGPGPGTSFAAPAIAGVIGRVLLALRATANDHGPRVGHLLVNGSVAPGLLADGRVTNAEVWSALNQSALYFQTAEYRPHEYREKNPVWMAAMLTLPILPTPWIQMGWGYPGPETWTRAVDAATGKPASDPMKQGAIGWMSQKDAMEHRAWG